MTPDPRVVLVAFVVATLLCALLLAAVVVGVLLIVQRRGTFGGVVGVRPSPLGVTPAPAQAEEVALGAISQATEDRLAAHLLQIPGYTPATAAAEARELLARAEGIAAG